MHTVVAMLMHTTLPMHNMYFYLNDPECIHLGVRIQVQLQFADNKHNITGNYKKFILIEQ